MQINSYIFFYYIGGSMTILDMLQQSLYLTMLGMGIVFAFLVILIVCMILCHKVLHALKLDREPEAPAAATTQASAMTRDISPL